MFKNYIININEDLDLLNNKMSNASGLKEVIQKEYDILRAQKEELNEKMIKDDDYKKK
jgi:hypothetical protein